MINDYSDYFYRYRVALLRGNRNIEYVPEDHRRMLKAMKKKSPRVVERLVRNHLEKTKQILLKSIDEGKIIP
jgi:DNA-binding GntR family transcriptional regulator